MNLEELKKSIRTVQDFPEKGVLFYDVTSIFMRPILFQFCLEKMFDYYQKKPFQAVACIESRGFIFASIMAYKRELPLILIRKPHKLPGATISSEIYTTEYSHDALEVQKDDIPQEGNVLLIDDVLATGGTMKTAADLLKKGGARVSSVFTIIELVDLIQFDLGVEDKYSILQV